ncbi:disease resistance protein Roq1 [Cryptomeria japonica]|uniref:disease resistance protein Roq1 n=1 Tax=Cryptomeria japonica TaxID=3369 RepID=UPI0027DA2E8E|nr:disease resistance protein Roq1 [Cryptomeria japonica]
MASSSTTQSRSIVSPKLYDVFISHRGPDVKDTLAKQLYDLLKERECKAFLDRKELQGGDSITSAIHNAICSSRVQIAIFSKGFAESSWCLDELVLMLQQTDAVFIPVFYDVEPKELRSTERGSYAAAFSDHQNKEKYRNNVPAWKEALASAAGISGYELSQHQHQDNLCEEIVSRVVQVVQEKEKSIPLHAAKYPVGLAELVQDFERSCSKTAGVVGIFGLGGSGKTTLGKELFNRKRSGYHTSCFLSDVRESHARGELHCLQSQLCKDLFPADQINISNVDQGIGVLKYRLGRARHLHFLIILDDIDDEHQLDALLPEGVLGLGSLVIITTRNQSVLRGADTSYKMKGMDEDHAKDLFCSHAFRGRDPPATYAKLVESFVRFCGGLPLSLIVLGAHVYSRDKHYWELELEKVKKIQPKDIMQRLKISFDGLDREEKQMFIDIACLFNKKKIWDLKSKAITIWKASGWSAEHAVQTLQDKCLIEVGWDKFEMHDHLRDLGRQIADDLGPPRLWRPELLRSVEAKGFERILAETKGRCFHSFYDSSLQTYITYFIAGTDLLWLEIKKLKFIPSWIPLRKLHILRVSNVEELWSTFQQQLQTNTQASFELRMLRIDQCPTLQKLPDLIGMFSHLEELEIDFSLEKTDISLVQSVKQLSNLRSLQLWSNEGEGSLFSGNFDLSKGRDSTNMDSSTSSRMDSLETIKLRGLRNISKLVISGEMCPRLRSLHVRWMENLKEMELKQLEKLNTLEVGKCDELETISGLSSLTGPQVFKINAHLHRLEHLAISGCRELQSIEGVEELAGLERLVIQMPEDGYAWVRKYIYGLRTLSVKTTILTQKAMSKASSKLNANLFSKVIDVQPLSEIERGGERITVEDEKFIECNHYICFACNIILCFFYRI